MKQVTDLDVLVVYNTNVALSAGQNKTKSTLPFNPTSPQASYNHAYAYFLDRCHSSGIKAGFTTSSDITASGKCHSYWTHHNDYWHKNQHSAQTHHIFDKITPHPGIRSIERKLLFEKGNVTPFNDPSLYKMFFDKQQTYLKLGKYGIPTLSLTPNKINQLANTIKEFKKLVSHHPHHSDFSSAIILKDRYGSGGNQVYKIVSPYINKITKITQKYPKTSFIIQPFLNFTHGYSYNNLPRSADFRLIYHHSKILQAYMRLAKSDDFRCNDHQGAESIYLSKKEIPINVKKLANHLAKTIAKPSSLYALDFSIADSGEVYFMEGNLGPGIYWDQTNKIHARKSKQLINCIVQEIKTRIFPLPSLNLKNDSLDTLHIPTIRSYLASNIA